MHLYQTQLLAKNSSIDLIVINEHSAEAIKLLIANGHQWMLYNVRLNVRCTEQACSSAVADVS